MASAPTQHDIVDTAVAAGSFDTLVAAVTAADLATTLKGAGPFTVFAPTDDAFAKLPAGTVDELVKPENKAKLAAILTLHVVSGKVMSSDITGPMSPASVNGEALTSATPGSVSATTRRSAAIRRAGWSAVRMASVVGTYGKSGCASGK